MRHLSWTISLAAVMAVTGAGLAFSQSNEAQRSPPPRTTETKDGFQVDPIIEQQADRIKQQTYRSRGVGEQKTWNLDIGRFQDNIPEPRQDFLDEPIGSYSGLRLRMPLRGGKQP